VPSPQSSPRGRGGHRPRVSLGIRMGGPDTKLQVREGSEAVWIYDVASSAFDKAVIDSNE
jgi:hypothetical protein